MLALSVQTNDICIRTDVKKTFILTGSNPSNLSDWQEVFTIDQANVSITGGTITGTTIVGSVSGTAFGTSITTIDSFPKAAYRAAKYIVTASNGSNFEVAEVLVVHDGVSAYSTTYGIVSSTGTSFVSLTASVSGNDVLLQATGTMSGNTAKIQKTYVSV